LSGSLALDRPKEVCKESSLELSSFQSKPGLWSPKLLSVIVAVRPGGHEPRALELLRRGTEGSLEVIVVEGQCPSRQRNVAARIASGEILLFLDDDTECSRDLLDVYIKVFREDSMVVAIGGPTLYFGRNFKERVTARVLSGRMVTGRSASRYASYGKRRTSDERELMLSNLAIRRRTFESSGGFEESLYPNEENLLLERIRARGGKILYEPSATANRPAPKVGWELIAKVFGYGRGRGSQVRCHPSPIGLSRAGAALAALLVPMLATAALPWTGHPVWIVSTLASSYYTMLAIRVSLRYGIHMGMVSSLAALSVHVAYAAGVAFGLMRGLPLRSRDVRITKCCAP